MAPKTSRSRRTKTEIQQEFASIAEELAEDKALVSSREAIASQLQEAAVKNAVSEISIEMIIRKIGDLGAEISKALGNLSEKLVSEVNLLSQVKSAIAIENEQLEKLHKIDVAATALDQLIEDYHVKKKELEQEVAAQKAEWEKEQALKIEEAAEYDKNLKTSRQRESEEYTYQQKIERKKAQDKAEAETALRDKQNREKQEALEKSWQQREEALKAQEDHLQELQAQVDGFPARLKEGVDKACEEATTQTEQRFSQQLFVLQKERESEQRISEMKIKSLEETQTRQQEQIARLQKQLDDAKKEVKEIAEKAIEGASGARALSHINQIAMEQAKNRSSQV
jgi:colicin import membrane protein